MIRYFILFVFLGCACSLSAGSASAKPAPLPSKNAAPAAPKTLVPVEKDLSGTAQVSGQSSVSPSQTISPNELLGNKNTDFIIHTNEELNPYLIIKLKNTANLSKVVITNRKDAKFHDRAKNLELWISEDFVKWRKVWVAGGKAEKEWIVELKNEKASYIKLALDDKNMLHLSKVKIFGIESND